jgi:hypothetical protein
MRLLNQAFLHRSETVEIDPRAQTPDPICETTTGFILRSANQQNGEEHHQNHRDGNSNRQYIPLLLSSATRWDRLSQCMSRHVGVLQIRIICLLCLSIRQRPLCGESVNTFVKLSHGRGEFKLMDRDYSGGPGSKLGRKMASLVGLRFPQALRALS